jgi:hypothetical protein
VDVAVGFQADRRLTRSYPETGFWDIVARAALGDTTFPPTRLLNNLQEGGLADQLLLKITYGMGISQRLSSEGDVRNIKEQD